MIRIVDLAARLAPFLALTFIYPHSQERSRIIWWQKLMQFHLPCKSNHSGEDARRYHIGAYTLWAGVWPTVCITIWTCDLFADLHGGSLRCEIDSEPLELVQSGAHALTAQIFVAKLAGLHLFNFFKEKIKGLKFVNDFMLQCTQDLLQNLIHILQMLIVCYRLQWLVLRIKKKGAFGLIFQLSPS